MSYKRWEGQRVKKIIVSMILLVVLIVFIIGIVDVAEDMGVFVSGLMTGIMFGGVTVMCYLGVMVVTVTETSMERERQRYELAAKEGLDAVVKVCEEMAERNKAEGAHWVWRLFGKKKDKL
jgi:hypothetical protein